MLNVISLFLLTMKGLESARGSALKGRSSDSVLNAVAHEVALLGERLGNISWNSRVPSVSNPADPPSRMRPVHWLPEGLRSTLHNSAWQLHGLKKGGDKDHAADS